MNTLTVLCALLALACACAPVGNKRSLKFIQMADTQFGFFADNRDFAREEEHFRKAIAAANVLMPAFVVVCGDLVHLPGDSAQVNAYKRIAATLNPAIRLYNVAGNHDVGNEPATESLAAYRRDFGPDYYSFGSGSMTGIVVNSSLMRDPGQAPAEHAAQEAWLHDALHKASVAGKKYIMVFQHHPLFLENAGEPDQYFNFPVETRKKYLALYQRFGVTHVFAGHYHRNSAGRTGKLEMITTGPVGRPLGTDPSGLRIVEVTANTVQHRYHALDSLAAR